MRKELKNFTNLILIDASGSMSSKLAEVIGGLKELFKSIKQDALKSPSNMTTIVAGFSGQNTFDIIVNTTDLNQLTDEIAEKYVTGGMTALYDAMGKSFKLVPEDQDGVFVNIITDGEENDSKVFSNNDIKELIQDSKSKNWVITFMGTTEDAVQNAVRMGVSIGNTMTFEDNARGVVYASTTRANSRMAYYTAVMDSTPIDTENLMNQEPKND